MVYEDIGILRGYLCAHICAYGLEDVSVVECEVVVIEDEVEYIQTSNNTFHPCFCRYFRPAAVSSWYGVLMYRMDICGCEHGLLREVTHVLDSVGMEYIFKFIKYKVRELEFCKITIFLKFRSWFDFSFMMFDWIFMVAD